MHILPASCIHRLLSTNRVFFLTVNPHRTIAPLAEGEFQLVAPAIEESWRRPRFLVCGYILMPDHWYALKGTGHPLMTTS